MWWLRGAEDRREYASIVIAIGLPLAVAALVVVVIEVLSSG